MDHRYICLILCNFCKVKITPLTSLFFENDMYMFQNEYRSEQKNSSLIADFSLTTGYKSSLSNNKNTISHIFTKYDVDLDLSNFESAK